MTELLQVQLDTGSSDLWLNTEGITLSDNAVDTGVFTSLTYGYVREVSVIYATNNNGLEMALSQLAMFSLPRHCLVPSRSLRRLSVRVSRMCLYYSADLGFTIVQSAPQEAMQPPITIEA